MTPKPIESLDARRRRFVRLALKVRKRAYAPYSKSPVGAVIVDDRGKVHTGCNVENASFPVTLCAEPVALGKMVSRGGRGIALVVVVTSSDEPALPCGKCRQMLVELGPKATIIGVNKRASIYVEYTMDELIPASFARGDLSGRG